MAGDWKEEFRRKTVSAEEAVRVIKSGDRVSFTHGREPPSLTRGHGRKEKRAEKCESLHAHSVAGFPLVP